MLTQNEAENHDAIRKIVADESEQTYRAKYYTGRKNDWGNELVNLAAQLARIRPDIPAHLIGADALELYATGKKLAALAVCDCNYGLTPRQETRRENLRVHAQNVASFYGLNANAYGDPRGYVLKLSGPGLTSNSFAGEGYGVA